MSNLKESIKDNLSEKSKFCLLVKDTAMVMEDEDAAGKMHHEMHVAMDMHAGIKEGHGEGLEVDMVLVGSIGTEDRLALIRALVNGLQTPPTERLVLALSLLRGEEESKNPLTV